MNFNFFEWIRDGVKRSVLLGVTDAVHQLGMPSDEEKSRETILAFLQDDSGLGGARKRLTGTTASGGSGGGGRKLGRSIADIHSG